MSHIASPPPSHSHITPSPLTPHSSPFTASAEAVAAAKAAQNEMYQALLTRRAALVSDFEKKAARYKDLLVKEMVREGGREGGRKRRQQVEKEGERGGMCEGGRMRKGERGWEEEACEGGKREGVLMVRRGGGKREEGGREGG